jgi:Family of unknown function (DUF6152)
MRKIVVGFGAVGLALFIAVGASLSAHHTVGAKFDPGKPVTLRGIITGIDWLNPHVHLFVNVTDGRGLTNWVVELESVVDLRASGWRRDSVKPGDRVTVQGFPARDGSSAVWGSSVVLSDSGKQVLNVTAPPQTAAAQPARPTPRWPDGQPRLGAPPGETGYWGSPTSRTLMESGIVVPVDNDGMLRNVADAGKVAPLQPWARGLYQVRQRNFLREDPMFLYCLPPGGPRQFQQPYGVQFIEERDRQRIWIFQGSGNRNWRHIYLDGREQRGQPTGDANNPLYFGRSVGKWEGDTLVVDIKGFNESFWFSNGGLPHTDMLHLVERYSRPDMNTLRYEVTIDDPGAYTRTWTSAWELKWIAGEELPVYYCQDNRP